MTLNYDGGQFEVDKVITPFASYIVVSYKDNNPLLGFDFTGDYIFRISGDGDLDSKVFKFIEQNLDLYVNCEKNITHKLDLPSGKLRDILNSDYIRVAANEFKTAQHAFEENLRNEITNIMTAGVPPLDECEKIVRDNFVLASWNQLIKRTSQNYLKFNHDIPPIDLIYDLEERGLVIIDSVTGSNCGFGVGSALFYEILSVGIREKSQNIPFMRETLQLKHVADAKIQYLPPLSHNPEKINELRKRGKVIRLNNNLAFVDYNSNTQNIKLLHGAIGYKFLFLEFHI